MIAEQKKTPLRFLAVLMLALVLLTGCGSGSKKAVRQLQLGQKYLTEQNYTEAVAAFTEVIRLAPENIPAYMGRAEAYTELEQYDDAKTDYTSVITKTESRPYMQAQAYMGRGSVSEKIGDVSAAQSDYELALKALESLDISEASDTLRQDVESLKDQIIDAINGLGGTDISTENGTDTGAANDFQQIMDSIEVGSEYASSKRYVLVNDYDGDGRQEAFGFFGTPQKNGEYPQWQKLHIYYIASDGTISKIYDADDEFSEDDMLCGTPANQKTMDPTDFSDSYLTVGKQTFALLETGYPDSYYFTMALTVYEGKPAVSYTDADLRPVAEDCFIAYGYGEQTIYVVREGEFIQVGTAASSELSEYNAADKNTPEKAWAKYKSGILQRIEEEAGHSTQNAEEHLLCADYDGDGREEAFAVVCEPTDDDWGLSNWARIYYITPSGYIFTVVEYASDGELFGFLRNQEEESTGVQNVLMSAGNQKFLLWEVSGGGSASITLILGVKDGVPYQPEVSGGYQMFQQSGSGYTGITSDFSKGYHDYIDHDFTFDAATGEFKEQ